MIFKCDWGKMWLEGGGGGAVDWRTVKGRGWGSTVECVGGEKKMKRWFGVESRVGG